MRLREEANTPASSYWLHHVLDDGGRRDYIDESIVRGFRGRRVVSLVMQVSTGNGNCEKIVYDTIRYEMLL